MRQPSIQVKTAVRAHTLLWKRLRSMNTLSGLAKWLAVTALSWASPSVPIGDRTCFCRQRSPKARLVYWATLVQWWTALLGLGCSNAPLARARPFAIGT
ncbi:MAG: hypothetical protein CVU36_23620 [Betaproteobacteria bacterium HGW-Betaproteobacteria-9]|nr:MAG: hypothetical protein CVU36_23620 [Betaproteobacteria bacterium HGW-Betaproteobacteria-9]